MSDGTLYEIVDDAPEPDFRKLGDELKHVLNCNSVDTYCNRSDRDIASALIQNIKLIAALCQSRTAQAGEVE